MLIGRNVYFRLTPKRNLLVIFNDCFPEKTIRISEQSKSKRVEKETQGILTLRNQIEAATTIASVKKDEATFGLLRFLKKQLKEQIRKQIRVNDAKKPRSWIIKAEPFGR
ncbi:hypothetical protein HHI36_002390 [Cryptolaemus montrouzieri]|uniref:Uncharacterized protein n=1 Tax=Cryptolaemus montrouzieri TaxID=559131 RepID=A0ABD2PAU8_9CUCU